MTNECPVCGENYEGCNHNLHDALGSLTPRTKQLEATVLTHTAQIAALQAASKPAKPAATEKRDKPTITKVGRIWLNAAGNVCHSGWEFDGRLYSSLHEAYIAGHFNLCGYTFDELARESVLKNPRVGDTFEYHQYGTNWIILEIIKRPDMDDCYWVKNVANGQNSGHITQSVFQPFKATGNFRPIADAPEAKAEVRVFKVHTMGDHYIVIGRGDLEYWDNGRFCGSANVNPIGLKSDATELSPTDAEAILKTLTLPVQPSEQAAQADKLYNGRTAAEWMKLADDRAEEYGVIVCQFKTLSDERNALRAELAAHKSTTPGAEGKRLLEMLEAASLMQYHDQAAYNWILNKFSIPKHETELDRDQWDAVLITQAQKALAERTAPPESLAASVVPMVRVLCACILAEGWQGNRVHKLSEDILAALNVKPAETPPVATLKADAGGMNTTVKSRPEYPAIQTEIFPISFESKAVKS